MTRSWQPNLSDAVERNFGRRLPLDVLWFGSPTIAYMASLLHQDEQSRNWPILVPIKGSGNKGPRFCVHSQGGNLSHYYELAQTLDDEQPVFGLQARGVYGGARPRHVIEEIATDCISAMREKQPCGPFPYCRVLERRDHRARYGKAARSKR